MLKLNVWTSLNGKETRIKNMDTQHLVNAINVVERNDTRYGPKHGAALPALLEERKRRAQNGDLHAALNEPGVWPGCLYDPPYADPSLWGRTAYGSKNWDPNGSTGYASRKPIHLNADMAPLLIDLDQRLRALEAKPDLIIIDEISKMPKVKRPAKKGKRK